MLASLLPNGSEHSAETYQPTLSLPLGISLIHNNTLDSMGVWMNARVVNTSP
jgi:hypothetical protein